jgi:hypothetical protein
MKLKIIEKEKVIRIPGRGDRTEPAIGICSCGTEVVLEHYQNNRCEKCGCSYRWDGMLKVPRKQKHGSRKPRPGKPRTSIVPSSSELRSIFGIVAEKGRKSKDGKVYQGGLPGLGKRH